MSEEMKKNAFKLFAQTQQTFAEAEEKAKQEAGTPRVERFRIGEDGEYSIRILPLAPVIDADGNVLPMERKGYEYPVHQLFLVIDLPVKRGKKAKKINIPVIRTTDKGVDKSVDLLDTYVKIAKEMYADDEELIKLIGNSSYNGGLRWNYTHAMYVLDVNADKERAKGPQLWQCSHSQYKSIDDAKMRLWKELREDGEQETCPISGLEDAYPVKVIRGNNNGKTEYTMEIGRKTLDIKEEEVDKLLDLPRIPEQIYRYTRYQLEATLEFLKQYDQKHDMEVCNEPDFEEAVKQLMGELSAEDTSHFDLAGAGEAKESGKGEVTINSLWNEYDAIVDQDLNEKSDEYQELREKIRQFIEDKDLDVRISRTKNNQQLLEEVEEALDSAQPKSKDKQEDKVKNDESEKEVEKEEKEEKEERPARRRPARPASDDDDDDDKEDSKKDDEQEKKPADEEQEERPARRRRLR